MKNEEILKKLKEEIEKFNKELKEFYLKNENENLNEYFKLLNNKKVKL